MDRPICEICMNECLCAFIADIREDEQESVRERIDIAYLEGREAAQREMTTALTALLAEYDAFKFDYKTPRGGLVEALEVANGINADWEAKEGHTLAKPYADIREGDEVEFLWHGVPVRGTVIHPDRNLAGGYLDLAAPEEMNGFVSYDTRQMQDFRVVSHADEVAQ